MNDILQYYEGDQKVQQKSKIYELLMSQNKWDDLENKVVNNLAQMLCNGIEERKQEIKSELNIFMQIAQKK